jgi:hypothetical protein
VTPGHAQACASLVFRVRTILLLQMIGGAADSRVHPRKTGTYMQFWDELEGKSLAGTYLLNRWLRTEGNAAWFATRYQDKLAIAYLVELTGNDDPVVASLEAVSRVQHPNIVQIDRVGRASIEGRSVAYAIQEPTEDNLSDALRERPLTTEETNQIAESLTGGLGALHAAGLRHGQVTPTTVLAVGDTVKLRSDCVRKVPAADKERNAAFAQDVSAMGALIFECLTQRRPADIDDPAFAKLPAPFAAIVKNTVAGRWGLKDVAGALRNPVEAPAAPAAEKAKPAERVAPVPLPSAPKAVPPPIAKPAPVAQPAAVAEDIQPKRSSGIRVIALVAIALVLGAVWYFMRGAHPKSVTPDAATASRSGPTAGDSTAAPTPPTPAPEAAAPAPPPTKPSPAAGQQRALDPASQQATTAATGAHKVWRVVVYTYGDQAKAQQRVEIILAKHPDLKPEVFTTNGHGPYLVTIGGPMDHDEAFQVRSHARGEGMAHDAYIQNYTH